MNYIVAVSGGVDSVVLLDMLAKKYVSIPDTYSAELIVAHVDHGIRPESSEDARFVEALAKQYKLPFRQKVLRLGESASEEQARNARYDFLYELAREYSATIATAHHQDDLIGSIAINLQRGTGWRGLAVLNRAGITRPLLDMTKTQLYEYAIAHKLEWVEDETNRHPKYLRNRLRAGVIGLGIDVASQIAKLRQQQLRLSREIDHEVGRILTAFGERRYAYTAVDSRVAIELLRQHVQEHTGYRPTAEQAERLLLAIKTARPHTTIDIARGIVARLNVQKFIVDTPRKVIK